MNSKTIEKKNISFATHSLLTESAKMTTNMTICHGPDAPGRYLFETGCGMHGLAGTRLAGAVKSCCPRASYSPKNGNQSGLNCDVSCDTLTAQESIDWNPCMNDYYDKHDEKEIYSSPF